MNPFQERLLLINTIGQCLLQEELMTASRMPFHKIYHASWNLLKTKESYVFIQGTGLDMLIERFGLDYDAENLRGLFNYYLRKREEEYIERKRNNLSSSRQSDSSGRLHIASIEESGSGNNHSDL